MVQFEHFLVLTYFLKNKTLKNIVKNKNEPYKFARNHWKITPWSINLC